MSIFSGEINTIGKLLIIEQTYCHKAINAKFVLDKLITIITNILTKIILITRSNLGDQGFVPNHDISQSTKKSCSLMKYDCTNYKKRDQLLKLNFIFLCRGEDELCKQHHNS